MSSPHYSNAAVSSPDYSKETGKAYAYPTDAESQSNSLSMFESKDSDEHHDDTHRGVERVDAVNRVLTQQGRVELFSGHLSFQPLKFLLLIFVFLQGYASGLDGLMSGSIQNFAGNYFNNAPSGGTINTVKSVIAAAAVVPYARLSDRIGRVEAWSFALVIFMVGRIVSAATPNWGGLFAGVVICQFGYTGFRFLASALTSDISQLRDRVFAMNIFLTPITINLWISSYIISSLIGARQERLANWRWGYGIGCIDVPMMTFLLIGTYGVAQYKTWKRKELPSFRLRHPGQSWLGAIWSFIEKLDLVGVILFAASLCLVLIPISIAGGEEKKWDHGYIIAMICVGGALFILFGIWEWFFSKAPFIPRERLEITFWAAVLAEFCWRFALAVELDYVRDVLLVAFNQTTISTQRLGQLYDFMQACTNICVGIILHFWPHPKVFVFAGSLIGLLGMGIMYKYRTIHDGISGFIAGDVLIGLGGGMMRFPMWTLVHAGLPHNQMAVATAFLMSVYQVAGAVGSAVSTAMWTQKLPGRLEDALGANMWKSAYKNPVIFIRKYKLGTRERTALIDSYDYIQRLLMIVSLSFAALVVILCFFIRNYSVGGKGQSFSDEERMEEIRRITTGKFWWFRRIVGY